MNSIVKKILAIAVGCIFGSVVNMALVMIGPSVISPPSGADVTTMEGLLASLPLFEPRHFIMPFLAHALGTFAGALLAALVAPTQKLQFALGIGFFFLAGGLANVFMLPSPVWFVVLDLGLAYIPISYLAGKLILKYSSNK